MTNSEPAAGRLPAPAVDRRPIADSGAQSITGPIPVTGPAGRLPPAGPPTLLGSLQQLRTALAQLRLDLDLPGTDAARADRRALIAQLDDYIVPRLLSVDAPLLAVVGGSTGAGKSALVNSLLGFPASRSGVIRPTTTSPVLVHHPADARYFTGQRILPSLARVTDDPAAGAGAAAGAGSGAVVGTGAGAGSERTGQDAGRSAVATSSDVADEPIRSVHLLATGAIPPGLALLDAPDIDSVVSSNRALASQLLAAADLWVFVTTAARYADAVPWNFLAGAAARQAAVAIVLNRVPPGAIDDIAGHLVWMLRQNGLGGSPLFVIPETPIDRAGLLPPPAVQPLKAWLGGLATDAAARQAIVRQTLTGAVDALLGRLRTLAGAGDQQRRAVAGLAAEVDEVYAAAAARITDGLADGSLLRTEVLSRWQEFLGTGEFMRNLESRIGRLRDRLVSAVKGEPRQDQQIAGALQSGVEQLIIGQVELAADEVMRRWITVPGGRALVSRHPELGRPAPGLPDRVARSVRDWQGAVLDMVRAEGKDKRTAARVLSYGVNGTGLMLMLVTFSQTAGLTGAEVGIAGGTAVLAQRLLEAVFGDQAVRLLVSRARTDLVQRGGQLLADDRRRPDALLGELSRGPTPEQLMSVGGMVARTR
jgi:hypothetical protein